MEMHKVHPEPQQGLSLDLIEAALQVQFENYSKIHGADFMELYQAFIALRQAQAMEELVEQMRQARGEVHLLNLTLHDTLDRGISEPVDYSDPFAEEE